MKNNNAKPNAGVDNRFLELPRRTGAGLAVFAALALLLGGCAHTAWIPRAVTPPQTESMKLELAEKLALASQCVYLADSFVKNPESLRDYLPCQQVEFIGKPAVKIADGGTEAYIVLEREKDIIVAFRGTLPPKAYFDLAVFRDWLHVLWDAPKEHFEEFPGLVHEGFGTALRNLYPQLRHDLAEIQGKYSQPKPVLITGHSKGGALAGLFAFRLAVETVTPPAAVYTFAAPRAGDNAFAQEYARLKLNHWRFEYGNDLVPHLPQDGEKINLSDCGMPSKAVLRVLGKYTHLGQVEYLARDKADGPVQLETCADELRFRRVNILNDLFQASACGDWDKLIKEHHKIETYVDAIQLLKQGVAKPDTTGLVCGMPEEWARR